MECDDGHMPPAIPPRPAPAPPLPPRPWQDAGLVSGTDDAEARDLLPSFDSQSRTDVQTSNSAHGSCEDISTEKSNTTKKTKTKTEPRKWAFINDAEACVLQFLGLQVPAFAATVALLALHIVQYSWNPLANELNGLLFAAKVHESLIIASLFEILYYHIRRGLFSSAGIPFGYLTSAFQLNSPFYLVSSTFLAPLVKYRPKTLRSLALSTLLIICFVLAALSGASSGIVMLPKLGWWEMQLARTNYTLFRDNAQNFRGFIVSPIENLYPSTVTVDGVPDECKGPEMPADTSQRCPAESYADAQSLAWATLATLGQLSRGITTNLTTSFNGVRALSYYDNPDEIFAIGAATCPLDAVTAVLDPPRWRSSGYPARLNARVSDQSDVVIPLKQPRVVIQCTDRSFPVHDRDTTPNDTAAAYTFHMLRGFYPDRKFSLDSALLDVANTSEAVFGFLDLAEHLPLRTSAVFFVRYNQTEDFNVRYSQGEDMLGLCWVDARWVESEAWLQFGPGGTLVQNTVAFNNRTLDFANQVPEDLIALDLEWLNALNITLRNAADNTFAFDHLVQLIRSASTVHAPADYALMLTKSLSIYLADSLSMVPYAHGIPLTLNSPTGPWADSISSNLPKNPPYSELVAAGFAKVEAQFAHNVYQYNFVGTSTKLAWGVLLAHALLVLGHVVTVGVHQSWSSSAWGQLGELVTLALNSSPNKMLLKNTGVRVDRWNLWRSTAFVRELDGDGRVQLVLRDGPAASSDDKEGGDEGLGEKLHSFRKYG